MNISEIAIELEALANRYTCAAENCNVHSGRYERRNWQRKARIIETAIRKLKGTMQLRELADAETKLNLRNALSMLHRLAPANSS
jgi:hypothetical protein